MNPLPGQSVRSRRVQLLRWGLAVGLPLYLLSSGPVAWATNDAFHPAYLPDWVNVIYLPLVPLTNLSCINGWWLWWTAIVWHGWPAGYTTL